VNIFGILNITEDSFSDGGQYLTPDAALAQAQHLASDGADVIDIGAAASNPDARPVPPEIEIARLTPVIAALQQQGVPVSVDSFSMEVQRWALAQNVDYLNDIQGFLDAELYSELSQSSARLIVMHSIQGRGPATRVHVPAEELMERIFVFFATRIAALTNAGVARERLILDPGMGLFVGTDRDASFTVLRGLRELKRTFERPILISVSRKSFLRRLTGRTASQSGAATLAAELFAVEQGADYVRTHEPAPLRDALLTWRALHPETDSNAA